MKKIVLGLLILSNIFILTSNTFELKINNDTDKNHEIFVGSKDTWQLYKNNQKDIIFLIKSGCQFSYLLIDIDKENILILNNESYQINLNAKNGLIEPNSMLKLKKFDLNLEIDIAEIYRNGTIKQYATLNLSDLI